MSKVLQEYMKREAKKPTQETTTTTPIRPVNYWQREQPKPTFTERLITYLSYIIIIGQLVAVAVLVYLFLFGLYSFLRV